MFKFQTQILFIAALITFALFSCGENKKIKKEEKNSDTVTAESELLDINKKITADPNNAALYHDRSLYFFNHGTYSRAMDDIQRALSIDSMNADYIYTKGDIFFSLMRFEEAMTSFQKCLSINKSHAEANLKTARILLYMRQFDECIKHINEALKSNVNLAEAYFLKGVVFQYAGDSVKAASSFQTAVEQKADYYDAYITLGLLYAAKKDSLAIQYYNSALSVRPNSQEALYDLGMYYQENGRYEDALKSYNQMTRFDQKSALGFYNKGYLYLVYLHQMNNAIPSFDSALRANPSFRDAYHNRGLAYRESGKYKEARADFRTALQLDPQFDLSANELDDMDRKHQ